MGTYTEFNFFSSATDVRIAGCWTGWIPEPMTRADGDRWTYSAPLTPGADVQFKFVVDGAWMPAEHYDKTDDGHGAKNNTRCIDEAREHPHDSPADQVAQLGKEAIESVADISTVAESAPILEKNQEVKETKEEIQEAEEGPQAQVEEGLQAVAEKGQQVAAEEPVEAAEEKVEESEDNGGDNAADLKDEKVDSVVQVPKDDAPDVQQAFTDEQHTPSEPLGKLLRLSESTSGSSDTTKSISPEESKEPALRTLSSTAEPSKVEKLLSECASDTEDRKPQEETAEDFEIEDSEEEEEKVVEQMEKVEQMEERVVDAESLKPVETVSVEKAKETKRKEQENDNCTMV